jgi:hypothetical protein
MGVLQPEEIEQPPGEPPYDLNPWRIALGLILGAEVPVAIHAWQNGPLWLPTLIVGNAVAVVLVLFAGIPLFELLRARRALKIYWAVVIGGALVTLQDLVFTLVGFGFGGTVALRVGGKTLISQDFLTIDGLQHFFLVRPAMFFVMGAIGGLIAWLIAFGPRYEPPRKAALRLPRPSRNPDSRETSVHA